VSNRYISPSRAESIDDLSPALARGIRRVGSMKVAVGAEQEKGLASNTIAALRRHGLVKDADARDRRGRRLWELTEAARRLRRTEQPVFLAQRSDALYTSDPTMAMRGEPEVLAPSPLELREARERHDSFKVRQAREATARIERRLEGLKELASEHRVVIRDDVRAIEALLRKVEQAVRVGGDPASSVRAIRARIVAIERQIVDQLSSLDEAA
jgi:hypothetical protein